MDTDDMLNETRWWFETGYNMAAEGRDQFPHGAFRSYRSGQSEKQAAVIAWEAGQRVWEVFNAAK